MIPIDRTYMVEICKLIDTLDQIRRNCYDFNYNLDIEIKRQVTAFRIEIARQIYGNLDNIITTDHFNLYFDVVILKLREHGYDFDERKLRIRTNFKLLELIYNTDTSYQYWEMKEEQLRKLIYFTKDHNFQHLWKSNITKSVKNLIFGNTGRLTIRVKSLKDLKRVIESWQSVGISIYWKDLAAEIDNEIRKREQTGRRIPDIRHTIGPLQKYVESLEAMDHSVDGTLVCHSMPQLHYDLNRRKVRQRVVVDGKHLRDYQMTRYFKAINHFTCRVDDNNCYGSLTVNHKIPLALGVELGGIDHPENYEVLCEVHHDEIEMDLLLKLRDLKDYNDKLRYLKQRYPEIFVQSERMISCCDQI